MGAFSAAVEALAPFNVPVIPTCLDAPSRPMVKAPARMGLATIRKLAESPRFETANAAILTGPRSRIVIVDIDEPGDEARREAVQIFGDTPLQIRSPSGGHHLWYRHTGERRSIRPKGLPLAVDVLGGGLAVVPPSQRRASEKKTAGRYEIASGSFDDIPNLSPMRWRPANDLRAERAERGIAGMRAGDGRNSTLFRIACSLATGLTTEAALAAELKSINADFADPLSDTDIACMTHSVMTYKREGRLFTTGSRVVLAAQDEVLACAAHPAALILLAYLRTCHGREHEFAVVPDGLAPILSQNSKTIRRARDFLVERKLLDRITQGGRIAGRNIPATYKFGKAND